MTGPVLTGPERVVRLAVRALPAAARDRYRAELLGELAVLPPRRAWAYVAGLLVHLPPLRAALGGSFPLLVVTRVDGSGQVYTWRAGTHRVHRYQRLTTEDGGRYLRCRVCGKDGPDHYSRPPLQITAVSARP